MDQFAACPHCGAEIPSSATFCKHCGSSDADGWSDETGDDGFDDFDYDEYVAENFPESPSQTSVKPVWRFVAFVLLLIFLLGYLLVL